MITLNDIKVGLADKVDQTVVDTFIRNSALFEKMLFDDAIAPTGNGSTLTYGYLRQKTTAAAKGRKINEEYTSTEATKEKESVDLVIMGGQFEIDRVLASAKSGEISFQLEDKIKATINRFNYLLINGDKNIETEFDGLDKMLDGSTTEITSAVDVSTVTDANALALTEEINGMIMLMAEKPDFIMANSKTILKLKSVAAKMGYKTSSEDAFGRSVEGYDGIPFLPLGRYYDDSQGKDVEIVDINSATGKSDIYFVKLGQQYLHGVTIQGGNQISVRLPDFATAGAVKKGDVEFVAAIALKNTRGAAVLRGVKVQGAVSSLGTLGVEIDGVGATAKVNVDPEKPKLTNKYYVKTSATTIAAPTAATPITTGAGEYVLLPADRVVNVTATHYVRVVEVAKGLLPVATGQKQQA